MRPGQTQTGTSSPVSASIHLFFWVYIHEIDLTMNSDKYEFVLVAGPTRETLVPV